MNYMVKVFQSISSIPVGERIYRLGESLHGALKRRKRGHRQKGFTLVELMVVVAVIAILAAIAMPQFMSAADKAKNAKELADIQIIRNATQLYMIDKNVDTPPTVDGLYKEGYLTEHVKTAKGEEYTISYEQVNGNAAKSVVVKAPGK